MMLRMELVPYSKRSSVGKKGGMVLEQWGPVGRREEGWFRGFGLDGQVGTAKREEEEAVGRVSEMLLRRLKEGGSGN